MPVSQTAWSENQIPIELSPAELEAIQAKMKALDELLKTTKHAKYKIELFFGKARSMRRPTSGIISWWESGSKLHGGGDAKIYICPGRRRKVNNCEAFIPDASNASAFLWCPQCGQRWEGEQVIGEHVANLMMQQWADVLLYYYVRLEHNADIYVVHAKEDIRTTAMIEQASQKGGDLLEKVRSRRARHIYPLANIIKDVSGGADLRKRFLAFLSA